MITISISTFLLMLCVAIHQRQHKKILANERYLASTKECLDFFTKTTLFVNTSVSFIQKDARTLALELVPDEKHPAGRHLEIHLNGQQRTKDTMNMLTKHIQAFSWSYWEPERKDWIKFDIGKTYSQLDFIRVILWGKNGKPLDVFIYSCYVSTHKQL